MSRSKNECTLSHSQSLSRQEDKLYINISDQQTPGVFAMINIKSSNLYQYLYQYTLNFKIVPTGDNEISIFW